ncbi:MAG: hypothetical protein KAR47_14810, partial [Planctomycetes bacterium]|nr:hypothetical protein [Planctomycetota bacterium]
MDCLQRQGEDFCAYLNLPRDFQMNICDNVVLPRWGWHNRDYTKMDPYASAPPAVVPGEHLAGIVYDSISGVDLEVWHFQDDAVSGHVIIYPFDPLNPDFSEGPSVFQPDYRPENYVYEWLLCGTSPPYVDGPGPSQMNPEGIAEFSKDLAFVLFTEDILPPDELDWGDAPEPAVAVGYPTTSGNNGANHVIGGPFLGPNGDEPDPEPDGQPDPAALGDDQDTIYGPPVNDDENGVTIPVPLVEGQPGTIDVEINGIVAPAVAILDVWVDWNGDQDWTDAGEKVTSGVHLLDTTVSITVTPPLGSAGTTFLRARINSTGSLPPDGPADDGEVEDHEVDIEQAQDWGDADDPYPTLQANNGANHLIDPLVYLGPGIGSIDGEPDGQPTAATDGDDND